MIRVLAFLVSLMLPMASAQTVVGQDKNALPEIGVVASDAITIDKEEEIGEIFMKQLRSQTPVISDPLMEEYINDLGNRLVINADNVKFPLSSSLSITPKSMLSLFLADILVCIQAGYITLITKVNWRPCLLTKLHNPAPYCAPHFCTTKASLLAMATMLGGILLALADPEAGVAAISASQAASAQFGINYTRSNEMEADRVGFDMLYRSGFDVAERPRFSVSWLKNPEGNPNSLHS